MPRRTQEERSSETKAKICEATLDALVEIGYERISTNIIAAKAGASRGALTHHYPKRDDLLAASFEHLIASWKASELFSEDTRPNRLDINEFIDTYWRDYFSHRHYAAALELMAAARHNNELGRSLRSILKDWAEERDQIVLQLLGLDCDDDRARHFVQTTLSTLRGIAMHQSIDNDPETVRHQLAIWKEIASRALGDFTTKR